MAHDRDPSRLRLLLDGLETTLDEIGPSLAVEPQIERGLADDVAELVLLERSQGEQALASLLEIRTMHTSS